MPRLTLSLVEGDCDGGDTDSVDLLAVWSEVNGRTVTIAQERQHYIAHGDLVEGSEVIQRDNDGEHTMRFEYEVSSEADRRRACSARLPS